MGRIHPDRTADKASIVALDEQKALRGYCELCRVWTSFIRPLERELCAGCGGKFTNKVGLQITSQRTPLLGKYKAIRHDRIAA